MVKVRIESRTDSRIIAEISFFRLYQKSKMIQWIKAGNRVWKFEFIASNESVYNKKLSWTITDVIQAKRLILRSIEKEKEYKDSKSE
ncbi:unnamed protein product [marine sediment metagenome]|uniref:Uncharacterized protein n=1 Tax=marine sediment metagenome TaxID=412755 RepID=X1FH37_9ZZZZ